MRANQESVCRIVIYRVVFVMMALAALAPRAHASQRTDRVKIQGPSLQGSEHDGAWLRGMRLAGMIPRATPGGPEGPGGSDVLVEILGFRGESVDAVRYDLDRGTQERTVLHPRALLGLQWADEVCLADGACKRVLHRIAAVTRDPSHNTMPAHGDNGDIWLYELHYTTAEDPAPEDWHNACPAGADREPLGLFVDGRWDRRGGWQPGGFTFSCAAGVIAKCARGWGYKPWKRLSVPGAGPISLRPLHLACVRAARADYCGDGIPHTVEGTPADLADRYGLNTLDREPGFTAEAAFGTRKASWVERPRHPTGSPGKRGWHFGTCTRPYPDPDADADDGDDAALIYVWSRPQEAPQRAGASAPVSPRQPL